MPYVAIVVVAVSAANYYALSPDRARSDEMWLILGLSYLALTLLALVRLARRPILATPEIIGVDPAGDSATEGDEDKDNDRSASASSSELRMLLQLRGGDLSVGMLTALVLVGAAFVARSSSDESSPLLAWLFQLYLRTGDLLANSPWLCALIVIAVLEEIVWRGLVQSELERLVGGRWSWPLSAVCYAIAMLPTAWQLADPGVGLNPLLPVTALGCGIFWGFMTAHFRRLLPAIVSHATFSYFAASMVLSF
ncbi:MAG: CPBP family intramembrane metalloprotease [Polyangiaceae bacterium]|nr:CPBP family intramembrane metalloprotease [Polyangiaceae bacterium]